MSSGHLVRRFFASLSRRPPSAEDEAWAHSWLTEAEAHLWDSMAVADRRHSIEVATRFSDRRPSATRAEMAGALLHDVGKTVSNLGPLGRAIATVVGPRTTGLRRYHAHEELGAEIAANVGSDPVSVALIRGQGDAAKDLRAADDSI